MKEVIHEFGVETDWVEPMAKAMGGFFSENHIIVPPEVHTGIRYVLSVNQDITVMFADVTYHQEVHFKLRNTRDDFIGVYFNLTEGDSAHTVEDATHPMGRWNYNFAIVESHVDLDYIVKADTKTYNFCIFLKKSLLRERLFYSGNLSKLPDYISNHKQSASFYYNIMSNTSLQFIDEFKKKEISPLCFDLFLSATVYNLLGDYLDELIKDNIVIDKVNNTDFTYIIASQEFIISKLQDPFPGIKILAENAFMSETKFKILYKKITGLTPYEFYLNNKLELTRDYLVSGKCSIGEIADLLKFSTPSNLTRLFKNYFGVLPKDYVAQI